MKVGIVLLAALLCIAGSAEAEGMAISREDLAPVYEFAEDYGSESAVKSMFEAAMTGKVPDEESIAGWLKEQIREPLEFLRRSLVGLVVPLLMLALMRCMLPGDRGGSTGAAFLLRMRLLLAFSEISMETLDAAAAGLEAVKQFTDAVSPVLTLLMTAAGMEGTAALVSPAAALAGNAAGELFLKCGLPLCRIALCLALAGCLSREIDLSRMVNMLKKLANWSAGLAITLFTSLLALQGGVSEGLDGVAVRTAKFAFDSAAPVIGSGVSDAWDSYVSGVMIAKNAVGVSGIAALFAAGAQPVLICLAGLLALSIAAAVLDVFGERETARAASQIGGICQMALSLCTAALAIGTILLGAAMAAGRNLIG